MKTITTSLIALGMALAVSTMLIQPVFAGSYDSPVHRSIMIDKKVGMPSNTKGGSVTVFYDNIPAQTYSFSPNQDVTYTLKVKNTSGVALTNVIVKDFGPSYMYLKAVGGTLDEGTQTLTIQAGDMAVNEEKSFTVHARIKPASQIPTGTVCATNKAHASADGVSDTDTAQLCIKNGTAATIPTTGPESGLALLGLASAMGYIGMRLRKLA